mmetsp:Transcript_30583/g.66727  ORF Transcript_30583/g.66727 Transcript_30583/m.66727 type:complete len:248 (-) Transcript_30583:214-957(-)|eukprot:CAMPEP_0118950884 /NCGR_PEP_ID=MMETSP1169-20130426/52171_1 /TAXON_ID=36882 /ORGANISM="Pyramimonas obovata, Strain CCMP722" /LENGTH=247 /DNA_ID=CAMNT_0006897819 /DNA_START=73 /DNA_END=816 /DNA_ORIENTATION=-
MTDITTETKDGAGGGSSIRHFYLALGGPEFKISTLKELLEAFSERQQQVTLAICCSSRDELDKAVRAIEEKLETSTREDDERVTSNKTAESLHTVSCLHSDLGSEGCAQVLRKFKTAKGKQRGLRVLALTDICLQSPVIHENLSAAHLLINFELPRTGKQYSQRCASMFGLHPSVLMRAAPPWKSGVDGSSNCKATSSTVVAVTLQRIVVNFVVPADMSTFRAIESACGVSISEMPMSIFDLEVAAP